MWPGGGEGTWGRAVGKGWLGQRRGLKSPKPHILLWAPEQSSEAGIGSVWWWEEAESLELNGPGLEFLIYHLIVAWPWKSHLTSPSLSFFTSKWG